MPRIAPKKKAVRARKQLAGQTLLTAPKRPAVLKTSDGDMIHFLGVQAVAFIQSRRFGSSECKSRKRFETACDVEFKTVRLLDEDDTAYTLCVRERRKNFWWPALKWALDLKRYRRIEGALWRPFSILDASVPLIRRALERPRPRPAWLLAAVKPAQKPASTSAQKPASTSAQKPAAASSLFVATAATSAPSKWPSVTTIEKIKTRSLESFTAEEIEEMEAVAVMLRSYERGRNRDLSPEL